MQNNMLNAIHSGYIAFRDEIKNDPEYQKFILGILRTDKTHDTSDTAHTSCEVEYNWIEHIEKALPYIDRAVKENRQFILREGETLPIEKIRRVSKTSVEHLARHSEYISREPEQSAEVVPDKLFMAENKSTYAVYENRFLYMLLCYIKDFCEIKHAKIQACSNAFLCETSFVKAVSDKGKKIDLSLKYKEESKGKDDGQSNETDEALKRIRCIIADVDALLKTGLMVEVSASPMLKPPISRTNVLQQNPCFVAAVELYDYLCAYVGDGYTRKDIFRSSGIISDQAREDYAMICAFISYLSHKHGGMAEELELEYTRKKEEKAQAYREELARKLAEQKQKLGDITKEASDYILTLEQAIESTDELIARAEQSIADAQQAMEAAEQAAIAQKDAEEALFESKKEIRRLEDVIRQNEQKHVHDMESASLRIKQKDDEADKAVLNARNQLQAEEAKFRSEYKALAEQYNLKSAQLMAKGLSENQKPDEDYSSKEAFIQLEAQYEAFRRFYEAEWKKAKRQIRKNSLKNN